MNIINVTPDIAETTVQQLLKNREEACVYSIADIPRAIVGNGGGSDEDVARDLNMLVVHMGNEGGTIISNVGDVDVGLFTHGYYGDHIRDELIRKIADEVKAKTGAEMTLDGNDHMIDGKKVIGHGSRMYDGMLYTAIHFSVYNSIGLIQKVCTKPMKKVPGALSDYGVTTEFVMQALDKVIKQQMEANDYAECESS